MTRVQKSIYLHNSGRYEIRIKRESLGGSYTDSFYTLEEAQKELSYLNDNYENEPNTGMFNNACRGGKIDHLHNWRQTSNRLKSKGSFTCTRCAKVYLSIKLNLHHIDHNRQNDSSDNFEILCTYCHREHHNLRGEDGRFI